MRLFKTKKSNISAARQSRQRRPKSTMFGERERPEIFSYYAQRGQRGERGDEPRRSTPILNDPLSRPGQAQAQRSAAWRRLRLIAVLVALVCLIISQSLLTQSPKIVFVGANSATYHYDANSYAKTAQNIVDSSIFSKTKWTFNTAAVNSGLEQAFPELAGVQTSIPFIGSAPIVHIIPGKPTLLVGTTTGQTFVVDDRGVAIATAKTGQTAPGLLTITDMSGLAVHPGHAALPGSTVAFIQDVVAQLKSQKISLISAILPAQSSELDIHIAGAAYIGKFNLQGDPRLQAGTFAAVKGQLDNSHTAVGQYIDVRLSGRAYYQ